MSTLLCRVTRCLRSRSVPSDTPFLLPSWGPAPAGPSGNAGRPGSREATCRERTGLRFLFPVWPGKGPEGGAGSEMDGFGAQASGGGGLGLGLAGGEWKNRTVWGSQSRTRPRERSLLKQARQTSVFPACKARKAAKGGCEGLGRHGLYFPSSPSSSLPPSLPSRLFLPFRPSQSLFFMGGPTGASGSESWAPERSL